MASARLPTPAEPVIRTACGNEFDSSAAFRRSATRSWLAGRSSLYSIVPPYPGILRASCSQSIGSIDSMPCFSWKKSVVP